MATCEGGEVKKSNEAEDRWGVRDISEGEGLVRDRKEEWME